MLKFKSLAFNPNAHLTAAEKLLPGLATVTVGSAALKGTCQFSMNGLNIMAVMQVAGDVASAQTIDSASDVTVEVTKKLHRTYKVNTSDTSVDTGFGALAVSAALVKEDGTLQALSPAVDEDSDPIPGAFTLPASVSAGDITLEVVVKVASGTAEVPASVASNNLQLDAGDVHITAIAMVEQAEGAKPSPTSFEVRSAKPWMVLGEERPLHIK